MKFSAMSRKANPTARPTTPASPRIESTARVRLSTDRPTRIPPMISTELRIEPTTERRSTFLTNGASRVSEWAPKSRARPNAASTIARAIRTSSHFCETTPPISPSAFPASCEAVMTWASVFIRLSTRRTPSTFLVNSVTPSCVSSSPTCPSIVTTPLATMTSTWRTPGYFERSCTKVPRTASSSTALPTAIGPGVVATVSCGFSGVGAGAGRSRSLA